MVTDMKETNRALLIEKISAAIAESELAIISLKEKTRPVAPDNAIGRISRMDAISNKSVNDASLRNAQDRLLKLRYALNAIDKPGFGICAECDKEIPLGRIMIMPESILCVRCAEQYE